MSRARDLSKLGNPNVIVADTERVGFGTQVPENAANASSSLISAGIVTATAFYGDGSNLEGVASAGLGTAVDDTKDSIGQNIYFTNAELSINENTTVNAPDTSNIAYTQYQQVTVESGSELIISDGDSFIPDVLGIGTALQASTAGAGNGLFGTVFADNIENAAGRGGPNFPLGITVAGVSTLSGNVSIGGTLTYEDVTNVDSIGIVTARNGIDITGASAGVNGSSNLLLKTGGNEKSRIDSSGRLLIGVTDTTNAHGSFDDLIVKASGGGNAGITIVTGTSNQATIAFSDGTSGTAQYNGYVQYSNNGDYLSIGAGGDDRLRIGSAGQFGVGGANYGTSGQILTSQGNSAAPQWATPAAGGAWEWVSGYDADAAAPGATGTVNFTGLSTAYSAYKVQVSHITFYGSGASRSDNLSAKIQSNGNWLGGTDYEHKTLRYDGGGGPDGYGSNVGYLKLTADMSTEFVSGDLTIPMMTRKDASGYSTPGFYGDFQTHGNRVMFGCKITNADVRTYGFTGVQVMAESYGFYTGRIDLYRLKRS